MSAPSFSCSRAEMISKLTHRFGGAAGLADDVEAGFLDINDVQKCRHAFRIDVVLHKQTRAVPLVPRKVVVTKMVERLLNGGWAERAAADAEHDEIVEVVANARRFFENGRDDFILIVRQFAPAHDRPFGAHAGNCRVDLRLHALELAAVDAAVAELVGHHVVKIQPQTHRVAPGFVGIAFHHNKNLQLVSNILPYFE